MEYHEICDREKKKLVLKKSYFMLNNERIENYNSCDPLYYI